jgi:DNA-binding NarL/FixJ family response regulator
MISILLVDDHPVFTDALRLALEGAKYQVVGEVRDGYTAISEFARLRPKVVILDVTLPGLNGFDVCREIRASDPRAVIILLTSRTDEVSVAEGLRCRASAFVSKNEGVRNLLTAIENALKGEPYVSQCLMKPIIETHLAATAAHAELLTARERQILQLVAEGLSSKEIADRLVVSVKTVETHRGRLMEKLDARNVADLVRYAIRQGIVEA